MMGPLMFLYDLDAFYLMFMMKVLLLMFRLKKLLMMLFAFEFAMVNMIFCFTYLSMPYDPVSLLIFLAVAAGEASVGLSLLISVLRQSGSDNMSGLSKTYEGL